MALMIGITRPERGFLLSDETEAGGFGGGGEPVAAFGESERAEMHAAIDRMIDTYDTVGAQLEAADDAKSTERRPQNAMAIDNARGGPR